MNLFGPAGSQTGNKTDSSAEKITGKEQDEGILNAIQKKQTIVNHGIKNFVRPREIGQGQLSCLKSQVIIKKQE